MNKKYAIVNDVDKPEPRLVTEVIKGKHYYMMRSAEEETHLKQYDGMTPERPAFLEDFGFDIVEKKDCVNFSLVRLSIATYKHGGIRVWQDKKKFSLPKVVLTFSKEKGLKQIDNARWIMNSGFGCLDLRVTHEKMTDVHCSLSLRPGYCNRGHIQLIIYGNYLYLDGADCFPRYFFSFEEADKHTREFLKWRNKTGESEFGKIKLLN